MIKRPSMCARPSVHLPDDDCSECMLAVEELRNDFEDYREETDATLSDHEERITANRNDIDVLIPLVNQNRDDISDLQECCDEVRPAIQSINNRFNDYYTKSETYTQAQVDEIIAQIETSHYEEVNVLPSVGEDNVIYLLDDGQGGKEQWIYSNNQWIMIGDTSIDLSDYVRIDQIPDMVHPVGDTVVRLDNINPGTLYSGTTWELVSQGRVLIGASEDYPLGSTGGATTHKHTNPTTNGSSAANTGSHTLTAAQSGNQAQTITSGGMSANATKSGGITFRRGIFSGGTLTHIIASATGVFSTSEATNVGRTLEQSTNTTEPKNTALTLSMDLAHTHSVSVAAKDATTGHSHTMAHTHTQGDTGDASNMSPYLAVNIWRRVS